MIYLFLGGISDAINDVRQPTFTYELTGRFEGNESWEHEAGSGRVGDKIEIQCKFNFERRPLAKIIMHLFRLLGGHFNIYEPTLRVLLPDNLEYIEGSAMMLRYDFMDKSDGMHITHVQTTADGLEIGPIDVDEAADIRISCRLVDGGLEQGENNRIVLAEVIVMDMTKEGDGVYLSVIN